MTSQDKTKKRQRAKKLMRQYELSAELAFDVVNGTCSLHDALVKAKAEAHIEILATKHGLSLEEAQDVYDKKIALNLLLSQKYSKAHIDKTDAKPLLQEGFLGYFWLHGPDFLEAAVYDVHQYECRLVYNEDSRIVQKHDIKAFSSTACAPFSKETAAASPILRIEDRYRISNRQLYRFVLDETPLRVTLLGGLQFSGFLSRVGRFECLLQCSDGEVVLMRHAISGIEEE